MLAAYSQQLMGKKAFAYKFAITSRNEVISEILKWSLYLHKQFLSQLCFGEEKKRYIPSKSLQRIKPKKLSSTK